MLWIFLSTLDLFRRSSAWHRPHFFYLQKFFSEYESPEKFILAYNGLGTWAQKSGSLAFHGCPVTRCSLTDDRTKAQDADAILYKDHFIHPGIVRPKNQIWILYFLECPYHTQSIRFANLINWTATYRRDSDLVAPYERWTYYDPQVNIVWLMHVLWYF